MISVFLRSIAAQVRALVASGKALHVTNSTADELELVAGLDWSEARYHITTATSSAQCRVTPCDIAWAWLKLSRCDISKEPNKLTHWWEAELHFKVRRSAECAELATIASRIDEPNGQSIELDGEELRLCSPINPHEGTRDGARAAWGHIANQLQPDPRPIIKAQYGCVGVRDANQGRTEIGDRYRHELEAL